MGFSFEEKSFEVVNQEFMDLYEKLVNEAPLFEGAKEMLQNIASNKSQRQFILSAAPQYHIDQELASRSLRDYFDDAFGLETVKADSKIGRGKELFSKHKLAGAKAIMFGDTRHDQEVADALEIDHHLIADGHQHSDYLKKFSSNVMASRFS